MTTSPPLGYIWHYKLYLMRGIRTKEERRVFWEFYYGNLAVKRSTLWSQCLLKDQEPSYLLDLYVPKIQRRVRLRVGLKLKPKI